MRHDRGFALVAVLAVCTLVFSLITVALCTTEIRVRLLGDARWRTEGELVASSALASTRLMQRRVLDTLSDGGRVSFASVTRVDGWRWHAAVVRSGALLQLVVEAERRDASGALIAARRASLLLVHDPADTVRVIGRRARF